MRTRKSKCRNLRAVPVSDALEDKLKPLVKGAGVALALETKGRFEKEVSRKLLLLSDASHYGFEKGYFHVSVVGGKACMINPAIKSHRNKLVLVGIPGTLADALMTRLVRVFTEQYHGNISIYTHPPRKQRAKRSSSARGKEGRSNVDRVHRSSRAGTDGARAGTRSRTTRSRKGEV